MSSEERTRNTLARGPFVALWSALLFSEGTTLHLWQIRHIPNRPQTLLRFTLFVAASIAFVASAIQFNTSAIAQTGTTPTDKREPEAKSSEASELLDRVRQELQKHHSVKADLLQNVSIADQQFKISGQYLSLGNAESGTRLKLSYTVIPDQGAQGEMVEVCDGKELWTMLTLPGSQRVTHRNILQIQKAAAAAQQKNVPDAALNVELGLGGLTALLASLERTMEFDAIKQDDSEGRRRTVIQGHWKKELAARFNKDKDGILPPFVPDFVRLYVNSETLFPERLLYLKKQADKKTLKPLLNLEFQNVELNGEVDEESFVFKIPKDVIPEDITKIYLDRLTPAAETAQPKK